MTCPPSPLAKSHLQAMADNNRAMAAQRAVSAPYIELISSFVSSWSSRWTLRLAAWFAGMYLHMYDNIKQSAAADQYHLTILLAQV